MCKNTAKYNYTDKVSDRHAVSLHVLYRNQDSTKRVGLIVKHKNDKRDQEQRREIKREKDKSAKRTSETPNKRKLLTQRRKNVEKNEEREKRGFFTFFPP